MKHLGPAGVYPGMESHWSQVTSAALHAVFLLIAFSVPVEAGADLLEPELEFERWVSSRFERPEPVEVRELTIELEHVDDPDVGGGVGTSGGPGTGSSQGERFGTRGSAEETGPRRLAEGAGEEPDSEVVGGGGGRGGNERETTHPNEGPDIDGASGGGGRGHASRPQLVGEGGGGVGSGGCGCNGPPTPGGGSARGMAGRTGHDLPPRVLPEPQLGRTPMLPEFVPPPEVPEDPCPACREKIERVIRAHLREVRYCYEMALRRDPRLEGEVLLSLSVDAAGREPTRVEATHSLGDEEFLGCVESKMSRWFFPPLGQPGRANFPVRLHTD